MNIIFDADLTNEVDNNFALALQKDKIKEELFNKNKMCL